jgi:hypothetical protein
MKRIKYIIFIGFAVIWSLFRIYCMSDSILAGGESSSFLFLMPDIVLWILPIGFLYWAIDTEMKRVIHVVFVVSVPIWTLYMIIALFAMSGFHDYSTELSDVVFEVVIVVILWGLPIWFVRWAINRFLKKK